MHGDEMIELSNERKFEEMRELEERLRKLRSEVSNSTN